jgi:outer membrane protein OmpA-like peptidoglycan-associated protein
MWRLRGDSLTFMWGSGGGDYYAIWRLAPWAEQVTPFVPCKQSWRRAAGGGWCAGAALRVFEEGKMRNYKVLPVTIYGMRFIPNQKPNFRPYLPSSESRIYFAPANAHRGVSGARPLPALYVKNTGKPKMMLRTILTLTAVCGGLLALAPDSQAQTPASNAAAPTKDDIIKALTPPPETAAPTGTRSATRGVGKRGLARTNNQSAAQASAPPSSEMQDTANSTYFEFNSAQLTPFGLKVVDEYVKALKDPALSPFAFRIVGHTDGVGADKYNDELSQKRAQSVKSYMIAHGVAPMKLETLGAGKRELKNRDNPNSSENRRVVIMNLGQK